MSKTLSEQVAELERQIAEAWDIAEAWKLDSVHHWRRVKELEAASDHRKVNKWDGLCADVGVDPDSTISTVREAIERKAKIDWSSFASVAEGKGWIEDDDFPCCTDIPVAAETIRATEPGSTWEESGGDVWEWTGRDLRHHSECPCEDCAREGLGAAQNLERAVAKYGPLARSTAEPRGDYDTPPRLAATWDQGDLRPFLDQFNDEVTRIAKATATPRICKEC